MLKNLSEKRYFSNLQIILISFPFIIIDIINNYRYYNS